MIWTKRHRIKFWTLGLTLRRNKLAILLFCVPIAFVAAFGWLKVAAPNLQLDANLCLSDRAPAHHTLVLIDQTDRHTEESRTQMLRSLTEIVRGMPPFGRLSIRTLQGGSGTSLPVLFSKCKPGLVNEFYQTPAAIEKLLQTDFLAPMQRAMLELEIDREADQTPIVEGIAFLTMLSDFRGDVGKRQLVIFSDLMQNSKNWTQYTLNWSESAFYETNFYKSLDLDLKNMNVILYYMTRSNISKFQTSSHPLFWRNFFYREGAQAVSLRELANEG